MDPSSHDHVSESAPEVAHARQCLAEGEALLDRGRLDDALCMLREAVRLDPRSAVARNKLGCATPRRGELDLARREFAAALEVDPGFAPAYSNLGNLHREAGRLDDAVAAYQQAIKLDPEYPIAHHNLGVVYKQMGRIGEAVEHLKRAARLERDRVGREAKQKHLGARWGGLFWIAIILLLAYLFVQR